MKSSLLFWGSPSGGGSGPSTVPAQTVSSPCRLRPQPRYLQTPSRSNFSMVGLVAIILQAVITRRFAAAGVTYLRAFSTTCDQLSNPSFTNPAPPGVRSYRIISACEPSEAFRLASQRHERRCQRLRCPVSDTSLFVRQRPVIRQEVAARDVR